MRYLTFGSEEKSSYKICILVNDIRKDDIRKAYIEPYGLNEDDIIVITLHQNPDKKKTPVAEQKAYIIDELTPTLNDLGVEYLIIGDGEYFKTFTKASKVDKFLGYIKPTEFGDWKVVYVPYYRTIFYDPEKVTAKIAMGINALKSWMAGTYQDPGVDIIKFAAYPQTPEEIEHWLQKLLDMDCPLTIDIEAYSLKHYSAGIGTIAFAWNQHEGIAFAVDYRESQEEALQIRSALLGFFLAFKQKAIYHHIGYDVYVLIYQLFMDHLLDNAGLLHGLETMMSNWDDTKLIAYLATNSCAGNKLSLKDLAQEFAGNYAQSEIQDIRKIPLPQLLQYNLIDALSTWYVHNKYYPIMVADQQLDIYESIFKPAMIDIVQMQLTGLPLDMNRVEEVKEILQLDSDNARARIQGNSWVQHYVYLLRQEHVKKRNLTLKTKQISISDPEVCRIEFNPNSDPQLQGLLYELLGLPVLALTDSKQPSVAGKTLASLKNHTKDQEVIELLDALIDFKAVDKILNSFIPAMVQAERGNDGWHYLFGYFNLGGTVSGRLSSSNPNLQNLPANSKYAKLIKSCFKAPPGWFFCGIDFASLEDRISALTTKDPNKLKVYTDGYDGHALRATAYFGEQMPDIDPNSVESVNAIAEKGHKYSHLRQESKTPTFLLTYDGTWKGIVEQLGWTEEKAKAVEARYHELYKVSDEWKKAKIDQASKDGYVTVAFGLRVRTPLLAQTIRGLSKTPFQAEAESRTAGNALGQSWCLLNSRAGSEFMGKVRRSNMKHDIKPCAQIHDAQYYLVRDNIDAIEYANINVVKACEWQDHPDIWHDEVKLGGEFSIFYPDWSKECQLPNNASQEEILEVFSKHVHKLSSEAIPPAS